MQVSEIKDMIAHIGQVTAALEEAYIENGGEVTAETEQMEVDKAAMQEMLEGEGIDALGRWLKSKEDAKKALKAEKDAIARQMEATDRTIDYIKSLIYDACAAAGIVKAKGTCYSFTPYVSRSYVVDKEQLRERYAATVDKAIREAGVPEYITVSLTASGAKATEVGLRDEDLTLIGIETKQTVKFLKPRASKED